MQWHSDSFSIPDGATRILKGQYCDNQAFVYGNILAMQFHVELDRESIEHWAVNLVDKHPERSESAQSGQTIMEEMESKLKVSSQLAEHLYTTWFKQLTA